MKNDPTPHNRRRFLQTAATGVILGPYALTLPPQARAAESVARGASGPFPDFSKGHVVRTSGRLVGAERFVEAERAIPIAGRSQVLVVGAGPAGIGAALT